MAIINGELIVPELTIESLEKRKRNIQACHKQEKDLKNKTEEMNKEEIIRVTTIKEDLEKVELIKRKEENQKRIEELEGDLIKVDQKIKEMKGGKK